MSFSNIIKPIWLGSPCLVHILSMGSGQIAPKTSRPLFRSTRPLFRSTRPLFRTTRPLTRTFRKTYCLCFVSSILLFILCNNLVFVLSFMCISSLWGDSKSRNTLVKAEIHLKIVQMNLQWIENSEITHI